jgi:hypothetical protein
MSSQQPLGTLPFALRPNRAPHPGLPDMPRARRSTEQVQAEQAEKDAERAARAQSRQKTIKKAAQLEAGIRQTHEDKRRQAHNPPPAAIVRVPRQRPPTRGAHALRYGRLSPE